MPITTLRSPLNYTTQLDVENFLLMEINDSFSDQINNWIVAAEDFINDFTNYTTASGLFNEAIVEEISQTARVDNENNLVIFPRKYPVNSVERIDLIKGTSYLTLNLDNGTRTDYNGNVVTNHRYMIPEPADRIYYPASELSMTSGTLILTNFSQMRFSKFFTRMTYHAGYTTLPPQINLAATMLVADIVLRHENKNGLSLITQGRVTKEYFQRKGGESDLQIDAKDILRSYIKSTNWLIR